MGIVFVVLYIILAIITHAAILVFLFDDEMDSITVLMAIFWPIVAVIWGICIFHSKTMYFFKEKNKYREVEHLE